LKEPVINLTELKERTTAPLTAKSKDGTASLMKQSRDFRNRAAGKDHGLSPAEQFVRRISSSVWEEDSDLFC